jgi:V/A-type H+-transporting ATPase subunit E
MDGISRIIDRIASDAAAECDEIAAEAERHCAEIKAEYSKAEQEAYWKIVNAGAREAELRIERLGSVAQLEAKKQILAAKQELVARAFELAAQMLAELPKDKYVEVFAKLAAEASGGDAGALIFSASDAKRVGQRVCDGANAELAASGKKVKLTLSPETRSIRGGFIFTSGDVECNCSTDALIGQYRNKLSAEVVGALFE